MLWASQAASYNSDKQPPTLTIQTGHSTIFHFYFFFLQYGWIFYKFYSIITQTSDLSDGLCYSGILIEIIPTNTIWQNSIKHSCSGLYRSPNDSDIPSSVKAQFSEKISSISSALLVLLKSVFCVSSWSGFCSCSGFPDYSLCLFNQSAIIYCLRITSSGCTSASDMNLDIYSRIE